MPLKKSELYYSLWKSCDELRGGMVARKNEQEIGDKINKLVGIFEGLDFGRNRAEGDDLLGDAYEYLMRHFATESGKSKGQFYTPGRRLARDGSGD